ncbi:MAG: hypothetical protein IPJ69_04395 [Deltaproteobacteria bacterium]|nr:MAG: hypothetical protein IPJ69_04395 [Deltaproteobacteria bacterium]
MGGNGAQTGSLWDYMGEFFAVRPNVGFSTSDVGTDGGVNLSDRLMGADFRLTIPQLSNTQIYAEAFTEACCGVFKVLYGYYSGLYAPIFLSNNLDLRLEYSHFPGVFYRHGVFGNGQTLNRHLFGHHGGPDSDTALFEMRSILSEEWNNKFSFTYETYKGNIYSSLDGTADTTFASTTSAIERRFRFYDTLSYSKSHYTIEANTGLESLNNFNFESSQNRYNFLFGINLTIRP